MKNFSLSNEPKIKQGFIIPENYFENFPNLLDIKIETNKNQTKFVFINKKTWIYTVAAIMIICISIPVINKINTNLLPLDDASIENYFSYSPTITDTDLAMFLDDKDCRKINFGITIEDETIENELSKNPNFEMYLSQ